jgi:hypothetical protein
MTKSKLESYHLPMRYAVKLERYCPPSELEATIAEWVDHCNHEWYHESL